jgi:hypothetical protein
MAPAGTAPVAHHRPELVGGGRARPTKLKSLSEMAHPRAAALGEDAPVEGRLAAAVHGAGVGWDKRRIERSQVESRPRRQSGRARSPIRPGQAGADPAAHPPGQSGGAPVRGEPDIDPEQVRFVQELAWPLSETLDLLAGERDHDIRAAYVCLLTAGFAHAGTATVVGDPLGGWFWLPPMGLWANWARDAVVQTAAAARRRGYLDLVITHTAYHDQDGNRGGPAPQTADCLEAI